MSLSMPDSKTVKEAKDRKAKEKTGKAEVKAMTAARAANRYVTICVTKEFVSSVPTASSAKIQRILAEQPREL